MNGWWEERVDQEMIRLRLENEMKGKESWNEK